MKLLVLFFCTIFLSGCMTTPTYSPPGLTKENAIHLKADSEHDHGIFQAFDERLYINSINGLAAGDFFKGYPEDAYIKAGLTEVKVDYFQGKISSEGCVKFLAEEGEAYIIRKQRETWKVKYWVERDNDVSKEIVNLPCSE